MKTPFKKSYPLLGLVLLVSSGFALASESPTPETTPKGLAASDWSSIRAAYEEGRHAAHRQENGTLTARNPGQQWRTEFDGKGFTVTPEHGQWTWGLELTTYGERTLLSASSSLTHDGGKITCQRDEYLTEWLINDTRGLEQGWTIHSRETERESGTGVSPVSSNLTLTLAVHGDLEPQVSPDSTTVSFQTSSGGTALTYGGLKAWDAEGTNLLVRFEPAGENAIRIAVEDQSARYPITIDPIAQQAFLKASNTGAGDVFGTSVAVSGDTVVVGATGEDSSTTGVNSTPNESVNRSGAAYVFTRSGTTWSQQAYLKASNPGEEDWFGDSVAISGDTVVVGATYEGSSTTGVNSTPNESASGSGAAYVFTRSGTTWSQQAYLKASNTEGGDFFGRSVAVSGDTVIVGAFGEDSSTTGVNSTPNESAGLSGAAYVFTRSGMTWSQQAYLKASNTGASDLFGLSVAVSEDTVVIGAYQEASSTTGVNSTPNENASRSGAAYVFTRSGTTWSQQAYLKASNTGTNDEFGDSVAASGDTVVVGASNEDSNTTGVNSTSNESASASGAAYVFTRTGTTWSQQAYLKASNTGTNDEFGNSVSVSGDTVVVGAYGERSSTTGVNSTPNNSAGYSGAAYVFTRGGTAWSQQAYLKASNTGASDLFGNSVAVSGDTVVVGATGEASSTTGVNSTPNESANSSGAAYVFDLNAVLPIPEIAVQQAGTEIATSMTKAFGSIVVGSTSDLIFTVFNTGTADLTLSGTPKVAVTGSPDFTVTAQPASSITGPSGSTTFTVRFAPNSGGPKTASLSIPNNDGDETPFVIHLTGTGTIPLSTNADMGSLSVTEGSISGPILQLNPTFSPAITNYQVVISQDATAVILTGLVADPTATISAMGNMGTFGSLNVTYGLFGAGNPNPYSFNVMAQDGFTFKTYTINFLRSTPAEIAIQQAGGDIPISTTKAFGPSVVGSTTDLIFTILNTGTADLTLTGTPKVAVTGSPDFTVTAQPSSPTTGPSGSSGFTVRFTPTGSGLKTASLSIPNNDDDENPFVINLTGTAATALVLMPNGDFASGSTGWTEGGLINSFSYPVSGGNPGGYGIMNALPGQSGYWVGNNNAAISIASLGLTAGNCYTFSQDMRIEGGIGANIGGLKVEFLPSGTTGEMRIPLIGNGTTWATYNFNVLIPVGTTGIKIVPLWGLNSNVGFDNFTVQNIPTNPPQVGIPNPGFSIPTASGWERSGPLTGFTYPTSGGNPGGFGVMNASNGEWGVFVSNNSVILPLSGLSLTVGQTYSFTQDMKVFSGANVGGLKVEFYHGTTAIGDTGNVYQSKIGNGNTWETYTFTVLIPPNTTGIKIVPIWGPDSSVGFDNFAIMPAPPAPPPQATIAPATKVNWTPTNIFNSYQPQRSLDNVVYTVIGPAIVGTAVNSVFDADEAPFYRVMESLPGIQEEIYNGAFTEEESGPTGALGWQPITGQPPTRLLTGGRGDDGPCMRIKVVDLGGAGSSEIQQNTQNAYFIATGDAFPGTVPPGQTYNFEFWAKQIRATGAYEQRFKVSFLADSGGIITDGTFQKFTAPVGGAWTKFTLNGLVVPAGATSAFIQILGVTGTTTGDAGEVLIDDVSLSGPGFGLPTLFTTTTAPAVGISWPSTTGKSVKVQSSLNLANWTDFGVVVPGNNTIQTVFDTIVDPKKFYRIGELP